jgi:hypothetical protein
MPTCPAAAEQNDGDKRRENGPGKVTTVSVGQGEPPANLLTVVHKRCKRFFTHVAAASRKFLVLSSSFRFDYENEDDDGDDLVAAAPHCVICGLYGLRI